MMYFFHKTVRIQQDLRIHSHLLDVFKGLSSKGGNHVGESEILRIAGELGVDSKDIEEITSRPRILDNSIVSILLGFLLGFFLGAVFPRITYIRDEITYPGTRTGALPAFVMTKGKNRLITAILGIVLFALGFIISSNFIFARTEFVGYQYPDSILYGVFYRKSPGLPRATSSKALKGEI